MQPLQFSSLNLGRFDTELEARANLSHYIQPSNLSSALGLRYLQQEVCYDISTLFFFLPLQTKTSNSGIDKDLIFRHEDLAPAAALAAGMKIFSCLHTR